MLEYNKGDVILEVNNLVAAFQTNKALLKAVDNISFHVKKGVTLGIVGESGCGKSVSALSIMRLLPKPAGQYLSGEILFKGNNILKLDAKKLHEVRGNRISMIFQEPMTALNPVYTVARQLAEVFQLHQPELTKQEVYNQSINILNKVGIPDPEKRINEYPHQLSGGMRQRVMIAIALSCKPDILIADEPTTALDVTIQAQILELIKELQKETGMAVIFITHDLGVIAGLCDEVNVMYAGEIVEQAVVNDLFKNPKHPYTVGLLESIPRLENNRKSVLQTIPGMVPEISKYPVGCRFQERCKHVHDKCYKISPKLKNIDENHKVSCHLY